MDPVAPVQEDIRRVGRKELYTDFGKRMEYIKTFLDFTDGTFDLAAAFYLTSKQTADHCTQTTS